MAGMSPSALSRRKWRELGYHVETTEFFAQVAGGLPRRHDLFGFVDLLAVPSDAGAPWVYIQTTSWSNVAARKRKIERETHGKGQWAAPIVEMAANIVTRGDIILVEGWKKNPNNRWVAREDRISGIADGVCSWVRS